MQAPVYSLYLLFFDLLEVGVCIGYVNLHRLTPFLDARTSFIS